MRRLLVAIIGAGPAGIAAAVELKAAGIKMLLFLKSRSFCSTIRRLYPEGKGWINITKASISIQKEFVRLKQKQRNNFLKEWQDTLMIIR